MKYNFNVEQVTTDLIQWVKDYFKDKPKHVVIGMSGGKDSTIAAAILCKALGSENVFGIALPQGEQGINEADKICEYLGMDFAEINIGEACNTVVKGLHDAMEISHNTILNIPPRIRMTTLYGIAQSWPGGAFVVNTCNLSEDYIGYATKFGDAAGDFSLFANLTVTEILAIGDYLGIPYEWVHKTPDDGLPHSCPDEEKFGFTYAELDKYLREQIVPIGHVHNDENEWLKITKIDHMHQVNLHKLRPMPAFNPSF